MYSFRCLRQFLKNCPAVDEMKNTILINEFTRKAGNFQRAKFRPMPQERMNSLKKDFLKNCTEMTIDKWDEMRENLISNFKNINSNNIDATILGLCNEPEYLTLAKNYVAYLKEKRLEPNIATMGRLLRVYNAVYCQKGTLTIDEENEIIEICNGIRANHDVLDAITCEHLIHGLVCTQHRWKDTLDLLEMLKQTAVPSTSAYVEIIRKAFSSQELEIGWTILEEMIEQGKMPKCELFTVLLDIVSQNSETFRVHFQRLLKFLENHQLMLTQKVAEHIVELSKGSIIKFEANTTKIDRFGKCKNCMQHMKSVVISEKDYEKLRDSFLQRVLIRKDVFQKSTPEEINKFTQFVNDTMPYDCVIDGLNVAFSRGSNKTTKELANLLVAVVRYFEKQQKSVLVLGRKHMNDWPKNSMSYIRKHAHVYLTNNLTHDDPFMLYATLKSGPLTDFFSRDLLRSHAHLLGPDLKPIFRRWQQEHQFSLVTQTSSGKVLIKEPIRYLICPHEVNNTWHLPLIPAYTSHVPETFEIPDSWLCIRFENQIT